MKAFYSPIRWIFVFVFLTTAIGKLLDNRGFSEVLSTYQIFPEQILLVLGLSISLFELFLAGALIFRKFEAITHWLTLASYTGYFILAIVTNLRGLALQNCGCFGIFWARPMTWWTVLEDFIFVVLALLMLYLRSAKSPSH